MLFADAKDIKRANDLGKHSGVVNLSPLEIARGKASSMATAITDKRKILGRLEAVASVWNDFYVLIPFIDRCVDLWPGSQYEEAYKLAHNLRRYLKNDFNSIGISNKIIKDRNFLKNSSGIVLTGHSYEFDELARTIFNTLMRYN
jgi:hypothetical protein